MSAKTIGGPAYLRRLPPTTTLANLPSMHTPFWYSECTVIIVIRMTPKSCVQGCTEQVQIFVLSWTTCRRCQEQSYKLRPQIYDKTHKLQVNISP